MIPRRAISLLALAVLSVVLSTRVAAAPPRTLIEEPAPGAASGFDAATSAVFTCTLEPGPISNISNAFNQPDAFTAFAARIPSCGACPSPQKLDLKTISFRIRWLAPCTATAEVSVVRAIASGGCLVPDLTQVLCGPVMNPLVNTGSVGVVHTLPIPSGCCVSGDAFVVVRFIGLDGCSASGTASPLLTRATTACVNCRAFFKTAVTYPAFTDWCAIVPNDLWWRVEADCCVATEVGPPLPGAQVLRLAVSPNPATATAELMFEVPIGSDARLEIFDLAGRRCSTLAAGSFGGGPHRATWRGELDSGGIASPGVYRARLTSGEGTLTRQILWLPR